MANALNLMIIQIKLQMEYKKDLQQLCFELQS